MAIRHNQSKNSLEKNLISIKQRIVDLKKEKRETSILNRSEREYYSKKISKAEKEFKDYKRKHGL